jgi:hypothetical protein
LGGSFTGEVDTSTNLVDISTIPNLTGYDAGMDETPWLDEGE